MNDNFQLLRYFTNISPLLNPVHFTCVSQLKKILIGHFQFSTEIKFGVSLVYNFKKKSRNFETKLLSHLVNLSENNQTVQIEKRMSTQAMSP